jgi:rhamnogalacturonan endolyase
MIFIVVCFGVVILCGGAGFAQRQMERLGRGVVAVPVEEGKVYVGWRLLGTEPEAIAFNLYRVTDGGEPKRLNGEPITKTTDFVDTGVNREKSNAYFVRAVLDGKEQTASAAFTLAAGSEVRPYLAIPLQTLEGHRTGDAATGDLDGDGEYDIVVKQEMRPRDNSQGGYTGQTKLEGYKLDGTFLWRIDLGKNIREGAHYTPFIVYDLDGDGRAEVACKTADGTIDGTGKIIGDAAADYRNAQGRILEGPEYLTIFDGRTGAALATTDYAPARGDVGQWGDDTGNRMDRYVACVAYTDGKRPSLIMARGYYGPQSNRPARNELAAYNWRDGKLSQIWHFKAGLWINDDINRTYIAQGNHSIAVADLDGEGKDSIIYGGAVINPDGTGRYSTGLGHGDAQHTTAMIPERDGLQTFSIHENPRHPHGINVRDTATGKLLWSHASSDVGRGMAADIDPTNPGYEVWAAGSGLDALYAAATGETVSQRKPGSCNMAVWWDSDPLRELLNGTRIEKWIHDEERTETLLDARTYDCVSINGSKSNPCLSADILGDWREEVIWKTRDNRELRIFTTTIPATMRLYTLMHDPVYRLSAAWQNVGYNQPPHTGFYLGEGMKAPPRPNIRLDLGK